MQMQPWITTKFSQFNTKLNIYYINYILNRTFYAVVTEIPIKIKLQVINLKLIRLREQNCFFILVHNCVTNGILVTLTQSKDVTGFHNCITFCKIVNI
jgi:hypothetical protein